MPGVSQTGTRWSASILGTRTRVQRNLKPVSWNLYGHKKDAPLGTYMFSFQVGL